LERKLETKTGRASLAVRPKPYLGPQIAQGVRLAFRRGQRVDSWSTVTLLGTGSDKYKLNRFADAERPGIDANGTDVLDFHQARDHAKKLVGADRHSEDPATVAEALDAYERHLKATGGARFNVQYPRKHLPAHMMSRSLALVSSKELCHWRDGLLDKLAPASISRLCKCVRACFNHAAEHDDRIHANRKAWKVGLANLSESDEARGINILDPAEVLSLYTTAYEMDAALGLLMRGLAVTGARPSQVVRVRIAHFVDDPVKPRIMMPRSAKGSSKDRQKKRNQSYPVQITHELARRLRLAATGRGSDQYLFLRADGTPWHANPSNDYRDDIRTVITSLGKDPDRYTAYSLRHSNIVQMLRRGASAEIVGQCHDTSEKEIRKHYAAHFLHHHDDYARTLLIDDGPPVQLQGAENVIPIGGKAG